MASTRALAEDPHRTSLGLWGKELTLGMPHQRAGKWHLDLGIRTTCPKMEETEDLLERKLHRPLKLGILGQYESLETPLDRRSDFRNSTIYLGLGRQESDWLIWTFYVGGGIGKEETSEWSWGRRLETEFKHGTIYLGLAAEVYPWKVPLADDYEDWGGRFRASRPFVALGLETGYVHGEGEGAWSVGPFRIIQDDGEVDDWVTSFNLGLGWNLPITRRWSFVVTGDYRFHFYRPDEFNGFSLATALRYNLP